MCLVLLSCAVRGYLARKRFWQYVEMRWAAEQRRLRAGPCADCVLCCVSSCLCVCVFICLCVCVCICVCVSVYNSRFPRFCFHRTEAYHILEVCNEGKATLSDFFESKRGKKQMKAEANTLRTRNQVKKRERVQRIKGAHARGVCWGELMPCCWGRVLTCLSLRSLQAP